ncbi:hypothetical protein ACNKHS_18810 [Shigella flexneri]
MLFKGVTMGFQRGAGGIRRGDRQLAKVSCAPPYRPLGPDDILQIGLAKVFKTGFFHHFRQTGGAFSHDVVTRGSDRPDRTCCNQGGFF